MIVLFVRHALLEDGVAHVALICTGDGIENLRLVQGEHLRTSGGGRLVFDGRVLRPMAHDLRCDAALFRQRA